MLLADNAPYASTLSGWVISFLLLMIIAILGFMCRYFITQIDDQNTDIGKIKQDVAEIKGEMRNGRPRSGKW